MKRSLDADDRNAAHLHEYVLIRKLISLPLIPSP
jgi:hypothetical protein